MKIKFPKEVTILSNRMKIVQLKDTHGGYFSFGDCEIGIGVKGIKSDPHHVFQVISHELMEAILVCLGARFESPREEKHYLFSFDHQKFETANQVYCDIIVKFIE